LANNKNGFSTQTYIRKAKFDSKVPKDIYTATFYRYGTSLSELFNF